MGHRPTISAPPGFYGCPKCETVKPLSEFFKTKGGPDGHGSHCKTCKSAMRRAYRSPANAEKFWSRVDKSAGEDGCWPWTGPTHSENGYGLFGFAGRTRLTHRIALMIAGIEVPEGMVTDHLCRVRLCCNVKHLEVVTQRVNCHRGESVWAKNAKATHCAKGHPYSPENTARFFTYGKTRHGHPCQSPRRCRACLTCTPSKWRFAIVKRGPPNPNRATRSVWVGPQF